MSELAADLQQQLAALRAENDRLRQQLAAAAAAGAEPSSASPGPSGASADAAFAELWARMHKEIPDVFPERHAANLATFQQICDVFVEFIRMFATMELHVHSMLRDLRQVGDRADKLNHFYIMFTKNPGFVETLREYLLGGRRMGNFANLSRALQAWSRAFASGCYKVIVQSENVIAKDLNYRNWPIQKGTLTTEDAAIGKYVKEVASKSIPAALATELRRLVGEAAYEDYNALMKKQK